MASLPVNYSDNILRKYYQPYLTRLLHETAADVVLITRTRPDEGTF